MSGVPFWAWVIDLGGATWLFSAFVAAMPRGRRPDLAADLALRVALVAVLAEFGVFIQNADSKVPWIGPVIVVSVVLSLNSLRTATAHDIAALTRTQTFRVTGVVFVALWLIGTLPPQFALPAGLGDMAVGLSAPVIARRLNRGDTRGAITFHALGILDLVVAIGMGFLSTPGPFRLFTAQVSAAPITVLPMVLIPTVLVPLSLAVHFVSIHHLRTARSATAPRLASHPIPA